MVVLDDLRMSSSPERSPPEEPPSLACNNPRYRNISGSGPMDRIGLESRLADDASQSRSRTSNSNQIKGCRRPKETDSVPFVFEGRGAFLRAMATLEGST